MMFFDPLWLLFAIPGLLLGLYAQAKLTSAYGKSMVSSVMQLLYLISLGRGRS